MSLHESTQSSPRTTPSPGRLAAVGSMAFGVLAFAFGLYILVGGKTTIPLAVAVVVVGFLELVLGWFSLRRIRAAWAFACSLHGTGFLILLFGAPKIRDAADIAIGLALLPALVFGALTLLFALAADDY